MDIVSYVPCTFDPDEASPTFLPRTRRWRWSWLTGQLERHAEKGVMIRVPMWWQFTTPIVQASIAAHRFPFVSQLQNMPVEGEALRQTGIDAVVVPYGEMQELVQYLGDTNIELPRLWVLVCSLADMQVKTTTFPTTLIVRRSVHLFPGVPLLEECIETSGYFHGAPSVSIDTHTMLAAYGDDTGNVVSTVALSPVVRLARTQCSCGQQTFECIYA